MAPSTGPANVSVRSAPTTATMASAARRPCRVADPPNAMAMVDERYPPTMRAMTTRNETIPPASPRGSG